MEHLDLHIIIPRFYFAFFGWILYSLINLFSQKNKIDEIEIKNQRIKEWKEYWRKNWEIYPLSLITSFVLVIIIDVCVILYDAFEKTDYNSIISTAGADLATSFLIGIFGLKILGLIIKKGNKVDNI